MKTRYLSIAVVAFRDGEQYFFPHSVNMDYIIGSPEQQMSGINHQLEICFSALKDEGYKIVSFCYQVIDLEDNTDMDEAE